jgi:hypothetical protein
MQKSSFEHYQKTITAAIAKHSDEKLNAFCHDVILRMLPYVEKADKSNLYPAEIAIYQQLGEMVKTGAIDWQLVSQLLAEQTELDETDEDHAQEIDNDLLWFLCAMDDWLNFSSNKEKSSVESISEHLMNILDYYFVENVTLEDWVSVPQIATEYATQLAFLQET